MGEGPDFADTVAATGPETDDAPAATEVGRFRIERELGRGGMGVVYAAFDPKLERRVALKLLRGRGGDTTARLVREARAMARLSHPNVVTIHEVGELDDRAYFVMELVDGATIGDWSRAKPRSEREILDAFVAAGRGLAAAHDAGLVHRDFKPQNVLRSASGRIVVTDFGLARSEELRRASKPILATTAADGTTPLEGLTETGSVVGTPGYMAPEQWDGSISAASDQFAFCVALWEAFAGERPYRGSTVEELLTSIVQGTAGLDAARIPARLRGALRRGLDPDPALRWSSMHALLAELAPSSRRRWIPFAIAGGVLAIGAVVAVVATRERAASCAVPLLAPDGHWGKPDPRLSAQHAALIAETAARWQAIRARACTAPDASARLACLDAVSTRNDAVVRALLELPDSAIIEVGYVIVDPAICELPRPPRLVASQTPAFRAAIAAQVGGLRYIGFSGDAPPPPREIVVPDEPCAAAIATISRLFKTDPERWSAESVEVRRLAEICGDDRTLADVALLETRIAFLDRLVDSTSIAALRRAEAAVARVASPGLDGTLYYYRSAVAFAENRLDDAKRDIEQSRALYQQAKHLRGEGFALLEQIRLLTSGTAEDIAAVRPLVEGYRARAGAVLPDGDPILVLVDGQRAIWRLFNDGDVVGANAQLEALRARRHATPPRNPITVHGTVRDATGPVANAIVAAGSDLVGDSREPVLALPQIAHTIRRAQTAADGTFELTVERDATIVASKGELRSAAVVVAPTVDLTLGPTSRLEGRVELGGIAPSLVNFDVRDAGATTTYQLVGPIGRDGAFSVDGVRRGAVEVHVSYTTSTLQEDVFVPVDVREPRVTGISLDLRGEPSTLFVIARSTVRAPLEGAHVIVTPSATQPKTAREVQALARMVLVQAKQPARDTLPADIADKLRPGDLVAQLTRVPTNSTTVCAYAAVRGLLGDGLIEAIARSSDRFEVRCMKLVPHAKVMVLDVPPAPRLE